MSWYCDVACGHPLHGPYHDLEYGFPLTAETALFERLSLEIFQAGLSWLLVLNKRPALNRAFEGFDVDRVARFDRHAVARLLADATIIRNGRKIDAIIHNAQCVRRLRDSDGGLAKWLAGHHPQRKDDWLKLFRRTFKFAGSEVVGEFLMSIGYLPGSHRIDCPTYARILEQNPPWRQYGESFYAETD